MLLLFAFCVRCFVPSNWIRIGVASLFLFLFLFSYAFFLYLFSPIEPTLPTAGTHRNKIKKSSCQFKKSVSNLYARPICTAAVVANINGATYLEAKGQKDFKSHPHQSHQQRSSNAANMDFLISQVPATTNAVRQEQELRNNAGVLLLNGINNNLNVKQHLMHHQQQQQHRQHQQHLHHQQVQQKMTKKKLKLAQTQLDKLTQINIHLHGTYYFSIIFFLCIISIIIFVRFNRLFCVVPIFFCVLTRQRSNQQYLLLYSLTHYTLLCFFFVICFRRPLCYRLGIVPISETHVRSTH